VLQTFRYMIVWPTTVALGAGDSRTVLTINAVRVVAYPSAVVGGWLIGGLPGVVAGFIMGEAVALVTGLVIINRTVGAPFWKDFDRIALYAVVCAFIVAAALAEQTPLALFGFGFGAVVLIAWTIRRERAVLAEAIGIVAGMVGFRSID
jgi:lipopolysaccharide exporter